MSTATVQKPRPQPLPRPENLKERRVWKHLFRYSSGRTDPDHRDHEDDEHRKYGTAPVTSESLKRFWGFVHPHRHLVYLLLAVTLINQGAMVVMPVAIGRIMDSVLPRQDAMLLNLIAAGLIAFIFLRSAYLYVGRELVSLLGGLIVRDARVNLHKHLQKMSLRFLEEYQVGRICSRIMSDTQAIQQLLSGGVINTIANAFRLVFVAATLLWLDWQLTAVSCITLPFFVAGIWRHVKQLKPAHKELSEDRSRLFAKAAETFSGVRVVKTYGTEGRENLAFTKRVHEMVRKALLMHRSHFNMLVIWECATWLGLVGMIWFGGYRYMAGALTIGELVAFYGLLGMLFQPIAELLNVTETVQAAMASIEKLGEVFDEAPEIADRPNAKDAGTLQGEVVFQDVGFKYREPKRRSGESSRSSAVPAADAPKPRSHTLKGIRFSVKPGECVALVGHSGSGKSTIINLLARFYDVDSGSILVDGVDVRDYRMASFRRNMAIVLQENFLFKGTIRDNIAYARPEASEAEIVQAAKMAGAWEFIQANPEGLDMLCGERGVKLSGGQKQRISIARAILADPRILILDEATSALDSQAEAQIQAALDKLMRGRTTFVIAHRLSTIVDADKIVVMHEGEIAEMGTHDELIEKRGAYYRLFMEQYGKISFSSKTLKAITEWRTDREPAPALDDAELVVQPDFLGTQGVTAPHQRAPERERLLVPIDGAVPPVVKTPSGRWLRIVAKPKGRAQQDGYLSGRYVAAPAD
ncbi:MAG: ABC transporter ATP-binding protein/permease [Planctomycetota bacterium]|nr:ABC transporter ATP-binding protein/permease [Planctomycetota bacterium]